MSNNKVTDIRTRRKKRYTSFSQMMKEKMALYHTLALQEPDALASGRSIFEQPEEEDDEHEDETPKPHDGP